MKERIVSALIAIPLFTLIIVFAPTWGFKIFWLATLALAAWESAQMFSWTMRGRALFSILTASAVGAVLWSPSSKWVTLLMTVAALLWLLWVPHILYHYREVGSGGALSGLLPPTVALFFAAFAAAVVELRQAFGGGALLGLLVLVWAADAGAYFLGKRFGQRKFSPGISPNKTWEGFFGGQICALLCAGIWLFCLRGHPLLAGIENKLIFFAACVPALIYAALGDLFESLLKRRAGVKDSGRIMPGHGGVYDRIDSWLPALLIWALVCKLLLSVDI